MDPIQQFKKERNDDIARMADDETLKKVSLDWMIISDKYKYSYNYTWLGRPIIKYPTDIVATQEIIWSVKPDLIIETGIAHGGSLMLSASMLEIIGGDGLVLGIDIDIREHNLKEILNHPMSKRIRMIEGSSIAEDTIEQVRLIAEGKKKIMVFLDSLHSHAHVAAELKLYASLVSIGSYLVLPDTFIEYFPKGYYSKDRPWDVGNNPMTALREFLAKDNRFEIDRNLCDKLMITEAFEGYLKRMR